MNALPFHCPATQGFLIGGLILGLAIAGLAGCGSPGDFDRFPAAVPSDSEFTPSEEDSGLAFRSTVASSQEDLDTASAVESAPNGEPIARKLIQTADVNLVVEDFDTVPDRLETLVRQYHGFIANSRIGGQRGARRTGTWEVRIPADRFESFLAAAVGIGEIRSISRRARDVTEEFVDVEARIRNKKVQEDGLLRILEERPGKLEDVLAVERELSRVREEMERMQGRLRLLANLTSLATINMIVEEIKGYIPVESPTFGRRVARSLDASLLSLRQTGEVIVIALVALAPWVISLGILGLPTLWLIRRPRRPPSAAGPG